MRGRLPLRGSSVRYRFIAAAIAALLVATLLPQAGASAASSGDDAAEGEIIEIPYYSEPEYMLVAGDERWHVQNRPQGTVVAGYGHPPDAAHDAYTATARREPLGSPAGKTLLDVAFRRPSEPDQLAHSWAFAQYDDGTAEVWGPIDAGPEAPTRYSLTTNDVPDAEGTPIVGGAVITDGNGRTGSGPRPYVPVTIAVLNDGRLVRFTQEDGALTGERIGPAGTGALGAVSREFTAFGPNGVGASGVAPTSPAMLVTLTTTGDIIPAILGVTSTGEPRISVRPDLTDGAPSGTQGLRLTAPEVTQIAGSGKPALLDFDFACITSQQHMKLSDPAPRAPDDKDRGEIKGYVAKRWLPCPDGAFTDWRPDIRDQMKIQEAETVGGRITVAVGVPQEQTRLVVAFTRGDWLRYEGTSEIKGEIKDHYVFDASGDRRRDKVCRSGDSHPGVFDVRVVVSRTAIGCVGTSEVVGYSDGEEQRIFAGLDEFAALSWEQPLGAAFRERSNADREPRWYGGFLLPVVGRTLDRLAQPDPSRGTFAAPTSEVRYKEIETPTIQLQFPCEQLLGRPLGRPLGDDLNYLDNCPLPSSEVHPVGRPRNRTTMTVAGYGQVGGERRLFVTNRPADATWRERESYEWGLGPNYSWTVEPAPYRATDLESLREGAPGVEVDAFDRYQPPTAPPPPLLAQVPRDARSPLRILIKPGERIRQQPGLPLAVLQAPPTVEGLGQQTDFTPEFATSSSEGAGTSSSKSTQVGTHVGIEATLTAGAGALGNNVKAGGGVAVEFGFMQEVEQAFAQSVDFTTTESYGGSFADHTVVTETIVQKVADAVVLEDPSGLSTGHEFEYARPTDRNIVSSVPLSTLEEDKPGLYGPNGIYRPSLDLILGGARIGDPGSYRGGASQDRPSTLPAADGGPCIGGYADAGNPTPDPLFGPPMIVDPTMPFVGPLAAPKGPSILISKAHAVAVGNDLTEGATIEIAEAAEQSLLSTQSYNFSVSGIAKFQAEVSAGAASEFELTVKSGVDSGWSDGQGVTRTLGTGNTLSTVMGNIPQRLDAHNRWLLKEPYTWRMFMCKAPLGPLSLGNTVWVQGYVVDDYGGGGGITELHPVEATTPIASAVTRSGGQPVPVPAAPEPCSAQPDTVAFSWDQRGGTLRQQTLQIEDITGGTSTSHVVNSWEDPGDFNNSIKRSPDDNGSKPDGSPKDARPGCVQIASDSLVDGHLHRWRMTADGFVGNHERSQWQFFRPQVWPPSTDVAVRRPVVHDDGSVTLDIDQPEGVSSLRYDVVVYRQGQESEDGIVAQRRGVRDGYRTPELGPGSYVATVVGRNSHVHPDGSAALTAIRRVTFHIEERLQAQFAWDGCSEEPCRTLEDIAFTDMSLPGDDVAITDWWWDFGDGATSREQHPTHRYTTPPPSGSYEVRLRVRDELGRIDTLRQAVAVANRPATVALSIADDDRFQLRKPVTMHADVDDPDGDEAKAAVTWRLDDEGSLQGSTVTYEWQTAGRKVVTVKVVDEFGQSSFASAAVDVVAGPLADFSWGGCAGLTCTTGEDISFSDKSASPYDADIVAWSWDFGDGATSTEQNPVHRYATPPASGDYEARLTVTDANGAEDTKMHRVRIQNRPATVELSIADGQRVLVDAPLTMQADVADPDGDSALADVAWDFGDGATATGPSVTHTWEATGARTVRVDVTDEFGETTTRSVQMEVVAGPKADFTWSCASSRCPARTRVRFRDESVGQSAAIVAWSWDFGPAGTSDEQHPTVRFETAGDHRVTLEATDADGFRSKTSRIITISGSSIGIGDLLRLLRRNRDNRPFA